MAIEQYFQYDKMDWFTNDNPRYSTYHWEQMNRQAQVMARFVAQYCSRIENPTVGIVGFGFGRETNILLDEYEKTSSLDSLRVIALDINCSRFEQANSAIDSAQKVTLSAVVGSMNSLPIASEKLDCTVCLETLIHSDNLLQTIQEMRRVTKPDGYIICNMEISKGSVTDLGNLIRLEGIKRAAQRVGEKIMKRQEGFVRRTKYHSLVEIQEILFDSEKLTLIHQGTYSYGRTNLWILQKTNT